MMNDVLEAEGCGDGVVPCKNLVIGFIGGTFNSSGFQMRP